MDKLLALMGSDILGVEFTLLEITSSPGVTYFSDLIRFLTFTIHTLLLSTMAVTYIDAALALLALFLLYKAVSSSPYRLPPGPRRLPLIGNLLDMPTTQAWKEFATYDAEYGPISSLTVLGQNYVILNDFRMAVDLLHKRGNLYADRPTMHMAALSGWDRVLSSAKYGPRFREYRKLIGRVIGTRSGVAKFNGAEEAQSSMFMKRALEHPDDIDEATRKTAAAIVLHVVYGYKVLENQQDPLVQLADKAMAEFSQMTAPGAFFVDMIPALKQVPSWFPGASFKRLAEKYTKSCDDLGDVPLAYVKEQMAKGNESPSYVADLLKSEKSLTEDELYNIKWSAASFYGAGADTTVSVVYTYFLASVKYPGIQEKAQAEMDAVIGRNRLPTFEDRDSLPYIEALCNELYRWLPIVPLAVPHRAMEDDIYNDYHIPRNTLVVANVWKFLHDPELYKDPFTFNPDRFLGPNPEKDPREVGLFGFGRRVCPGNHLADATVWINVAKAVACLSVHPALDDAGKPIDPVADTNDGVIVRPLPFKCSVKPRFEKVMTLIQESLSDH